MDFDQPRPAGLKPTLRQAMIFILWAVLMTAGIRAAIRWHLLGNRPEIVCMTVPTQFGAWPLPVLASLFWLLDRPGRVAGWYSSCCMAAWGIVTGALLLLQDPAWYALTGRPTPMFPFAAILGLGCLWGARKQWQLVRSCSCPACGRRSVISIAHSARPRLERMRNTGGRGWCASCGADFTREGAGAWEAAEGHDARTPTHDDSGVA